MTAHGESPTTDVARRLRRAGWGVTEPAPGAIALPAGIEAGHLAAVLRSRGFEVRRESAGVELPLGGDVDRFHEVFAEISHGLDPDTWVLPTGELAQRVQAELDRLHEARLRLSGHAEREHRGLTAPDQPSGERWDSGQVWAHLAEFGSYWLDELDLILSGSGDEPVPFGRTKADPRRIEMIDRHRHDAVADLWAIIEADIAAVSAAIAELTKKDWERIGRHSTLGDMSLWDFGDHFTVGHYVEHADQLDELAGGGA